MDRGRPELFCLNSSSLQLSEGCWMLQRDLHRTCHPCHSATLPGDKDMSIHNMEMSSGIFERCWFPSHLDGNMFLFLFMFERENLWWTKSLGVQPTSTISLAKPLLQLSWFNSLLIFFPASSLSSLLILTNVSMKCVQTYFSHLCATDLVRGKYARNSSLKLASVQCPCSGILTESLHAGLASLGRHPSHYYKLITVNIGALLFYYALFIQQPVPAG